MVVVSPKSGSLEMIYIEMRYIKVLEIEFEW